MDKFLSNLTNTPGSNGTPLVYVIDRTDCMVKIANNPLLETEALSLDSWETYYQNMVHFGTHYRRYNSKVWQLLKKPLLGT